jgi:hypothetical protein
MYYVLCAIDACDVTFVRKLNLYIDNEASNNVLIWFV